MVENRLQYCQLFWFLCDFCRTCFFLKHRFLRVLWLHMNHSFHLKHKWGSTSYQQQRKWDPPEESKSGNDKKGPNTYWLKQYEFFSVFLGLVLLVVLHLFFVGSEEHCFFFCFWMFGKIVTMLTRVPIPHRLYSITPSSCWILTCDVNCQPQVGYLPTSWGPLFALELILGHSLSKVHWEKKRWDVGMAAGHGFVSSSLCRQLVWANMACYLLPKALPVEKTTLGRCMW